MLPHKRQHDPNKELFFINSDNKIFSKGSLNFHKPIRSQDTDLLADQKASILSLFHPIRPHKNIF